MTRTAEDAVAESLEDGRTRCAWVRGHPAHYDFHDAEFGRLPDSEEATFEKLLLTCLGRGREPTAVLDQRMDVYEALGSWEMEAAAGLDDAALDAATGRGGVLADGAELRWLRDVAGACVETAKEYKGLREYILALPSLSSEEKIAEVAARFPGFEKADAARFLEMVGAVESCPHQRDCWIA